MEYFFGASYQRYDKSGRREGFHDPPDQKVTYLLLILLIMKKPFSRRTESEVLTRLTILVNLILDLLQMKTTILT